MDLRGNFNKDFRKIQWTNIVNRVQIAGPYVIGFLEDFNIEYRNILSPNLIYQTMEMSECQYVSTAVSSNKNLSDIFVVYKMSFEDDDSQKFYALRLKQMRHEKQLKLWYKHKLFGVCLKYINLLRLPDSEYNGLLKLQVYENFVHRKRFLVCKAIVEKYLIPYTQVIGLFSFILPEAYSNNLFESFNKNDEVFQKLKKIKKIRLYQIF